MKQFYEPIREGNLFHRSNHHGGYSYVNGQNVRNVRPNRTAVGMSVTLARMQRLNAARNGRRDRLSAIFDKALPNRELNTPSMDVLRLVTRGTLDVLGHGHSLFDTRPAKCQCCGNGDPKKLVLTERGRNKLKAARRRLAERRAKWNAAAQDYVMFGAPLPEDYPK